MIQIPPNSAAILQGTQLAQRSEAEKERQLRRLNNLDRNSGLQGDRLEHQVESSDHSGGAGDDEGSGQGGAGYQAPEQGTDEQIKEPDRPHIDLRA